MKNEHMTIKPLTLKQANAYVIEKHRHHGKVQGYKFAIGVYEDDILHGVAIVGHPQGRYDDDGETVEVLRLCTDGKRNACSMLYGRCAKVAKDLGYKKIITFILESESGISLKASGWICENEKCGGFDWSKNKRYRERHKYEQLSMFETKLPPPQFKKKWSKKL